MHKNYKGADQPLIPRCLTSATFIRSLEGIIHATCIIATCTCNVFPVLVTKQGDGRISLPPAQKSDFMAAWPT